MSNKIQDAFDQIHATEQMKNTAYALLQHNLKDRKKRYYRPIFKRLAAACVLLFICTGFTGWHLWETPVSYVSVDINPSVELTLNRFNRVTNAEGKNRDGVILLGDIKLKGRGYIEAVELLVESDSMKSYLAKDSALTFTVASPKAEELLQGLESSAVSSKYQSTCRQAEMNSVHVAHECGISLGKYQIYLHLAKYDDTITPDDCRNMSMHRLLELLSAYEDIDFEPSGHHSQEQEEHNPVQENGTEKCTPKNNSKHDNTEDGGHHRNRKK